MMVASQLLNKEFEVTDSLVNVLVVENKLLFRDIICSFENDTIDDILVFSHDYKPFDFRKCGYFISNPINVDFDLKKLHNKVNMYLEQLSESELFEQLYKIRSSIFEFADKLLEIDDYEHCYEENIETLDIIKMIDFKIDKEGMTLSEQLIAFMKMCSKYLNIKLFVVLNLHLYFTCEEIEYIYESLEVNHLLMLIVDSFQPDTIIKKENHLIVDDDLCIIDGLSI